MPAISTTNLTINFDNNITQVIINDQTFTSSGETKSISGIVGMSYSSKVTLKDNYIIDTISGANKLTDYSFSYTFTTTDTTITITSKLEDEYTAEIYLLNDTLILTNTFTVDNLDFKYDGSQFTVIRLTKDSSNIYHLNFLSSIDAGYSKQIYEGLSGGSLTTPHKLYFKNKVTDSSLLEFFNTNATKFSIASKVSIDLTTLSGWDNVTSGEHQISVVAKAQGYLDSEKSTAVTFTKASVSTGETWVLNDILSFGIKNWSYNVNFTSNGNSYNTFAFNFLSPLEAYLVYDSTNVYDANSYVWTNTAYKTITFETAPTGDLLTWLQANGTKQGGGETKTFMQVSVTLTNPYSNGINVNASNAPFGRISNMDKTKIYSLYISGYSNVFYITYNGTQWANADNIVTIKAQTETSVDLCLSGSMDTDGTSSIWKVIALEGTTQASVSDFDGYTATETMPMYLCIVEGTLITLSDYSTKPIEEITYDDDLLVWNFYEGKFDTAKPCWITKPLVANKYNLCKFSNGLEIGFVGQGGNIGYHRIYNDELKSFTHTGVKETPIGTHTFAQDKTNPTLIEQHIVNKSVKFYNIGTQNHINIFANGILTSSYISNKYAIENMTYIGERLISEQEEQDYIIKKLNKC